MSHCVRTLVACLALLAATASGTAQQPERLNVHRDKAADDRALLPEAVREAVARSRASFVETYDPERHYGLVAEQLKEARLRKAAPIEESDPAKREIIEADRAWIVSGLESQLKETRARIARNVGWAPEVDDANPLLPIDWWDAMAIGNVGYVGPTETSRGSVGAVKCLKILGKNRFLGRYERHHSSSGSVSAVTTSRPCIFVGLERDEDGQEFAEGQLHRVKFNAVVTDVEHWRTYVAPIYVLERFDPDVHFERSR
jgi:hypothetical protein